MVKSAKFCTALLAMSISSISFGKDFNYSYLQASVGKSETDIEGESIDIDGDEVSLSAQFELSDNFAVGISYQDIDADFDIDGTAFGFGFGFFGPVADRTDFFGRVAFIDAEVDTIFGSTDDTGHELSLGIRHGLNDNFEVSASVGLLDVFDEDTTTFTFGGLADVAQNVSIGASYSRSDDVNGFFIPVRLYF